MGEHKSVGELDIIKKKAQSKPELERVLWGVSVWLNYTVLQGLKEKHYVVILYQCFPMSSVQSWLGVKKMY